MNLSLRTRWLPLFALLGLVMFASAQAQQTSPIPSPADNANLVFPIAELGNCSDLGTCSSFCEDPVNHTTCTAFAKEKGFYKDDVTVAAPEDFWTKAKDALGCDSRESCEAACSQADNQAKCHEFAVQENLIGGYVIDPHKEAIIAAAQISLGCDSYEACQTACADPANESKCTNFAQQVGLRGGEVKEGPGGCTSDGTCQAFCSDPNNYGECTQFFDPAEGTFQGPGGCDSPQSCRSYCEENQNECRTYAPGSNGVYMPIACPTGQDYGPDGVCTPAELTEEAGACDQAGQFWNGTTCAAQAPIGIIPTVGTPYFEPREDMGGCQTPSECYDFCSSNPGQCGGFNPSQTTRPPDTYNPHIYVTPGEFVKFEPKVELGNCDSPGACYDYCNENPTVCAGFDPKSPRPVDVYVPGVYYTPPINIPYFTPSEVGFYVTPTYATPPSGNPNYTTPAYYTPGMYTTPRYYTPSGGNYTTPTYYTPGTYYPTPTGSYPTPTYVSPSYYTPPVFANYTTPTYYTPPQYTTPQYFTPPPGSTYTTPTYQTPPLYTTPSYYTPPGSLLGIRYVTPAYYTPATDSNYTTPNYTTPNYYTPGGYYTPAYTTPIGSTYASPAYYSPGAGYATPQYYTPPAGSNYATPNYPSPQYYSPNYSTPSYTTPPPGSTYYSPSGGYGYPSPSYGSPSYGTPSTSTGYATPSYQYPTPSSTTTTGGYSYPSPSYGSPSYGTPSTEGYATPTYSYPSPEYQTPSYGTPEYSTPYGTPESYNSPYSYPTPSGGTAGARNYNPFYWLLNMFRS